MYRFYSTREDAPRAALDLALLDYKNVLTFRTSDSHAVAFISDSIESWF